jgi:hypothetical protein
MAEVVRNETVMLTNGNTAKIISVIRENNNPCMIVGRQDDGNLLIWNHDGGSEYLGYDIIKVME